jgi:hypothetical protein
MLAIDAMETLLQQDQNGETKRNTMLPDYIGAGPPRVLRRSVAVLQKLVKPNFSLDSQLFR